MIDLSKKDRKILWELDRDARQTAAQIAKKTRLSQQVVDYRIKRMEEQGIISGYHTIINFSKFGFMYCRILLKLRNADEKKVEEMFHTLKNMEKTVWISRNHGCWDFATVFMVKTIPELNEQFKEIMYQYGHYIEDKMISIAVKFFNFKSKFLLEDSHIVNIPYTVSGLDTTEAELNEKDIELIQAISKNSRIKLIELSEKTKIPLQTLRSRIRKLEEQNIIQEYRPSINFHKLGLLHYHVFLKLDNLNKKNESIITHYLINNHMTIYTTFALSGADLEFDVLLRSDYQLTEFMNRMSNLFPSILRNYSFMLMYRVEDMGYFPKKRI